MIVTRTYSLSREKLDVPIFNKFLLSFYFNSDIFDIVPKISYGKFLNPENLSLNDLSCTTYCESIEYY
jgi:hypothetical protein